jgi:uncharacterized protein YigE (DUF2233 family)
MASDRAAAVTARRSRVTACALAVAGLALGSGARGAPQGGHEGGHDAGHDAAPSSLEPERPATRVEWQPVVPGAERASLSVEGQPVIALYRFDLERFRAEVVVGKGQPPHPRTAADLRQGRGAVAAINGGFFDEHVVPLGLRISDGETRFPLRAKADWGVLVLSGHRARIVHTRDYPPPPVDATAPRIDGAIQVGPRLVVDGVAVKLRPQTARRTAVAVDREGRALTLIVATAAIDANLLATRLAELGFDAALLLDGGPSTQASLELGEAHLEVDGAYPVPDLLAIFNRPPPRKVNGPSPLVAPPTRRDARHP